MKIKNFFHIHKMKFIQGLPKSTSKVNDNVNSINIQKEIEDIKIIKVEIEFFVNIDFL